MTGPSCVHVVEIDGLLEGEAAARAVDEAVALKGIVPARDDLVVAVRRFDLECGAQVS
jgi:glycerol-3-phosphate responsive antiterminator